MTGINYAWACPGHRQQVGVGGQGGRTEAAGAEAQGDPENRVTGVVGLHTSPWSPYRTEVMDVSTNHTVGSQ